MCNIFMPEYRFAEENGRFTPYTTSQCFICDNVVCDKGTPLLMSSAPYSKIALPTKIGQLMGDGFMVIVTSDDVLCSRCSALIVRLDKLEVDVSVVKKALTGYLKMKYNLYEEEDNESEYADYTYTKGTEEEAHQSTDCDDQQIYQAFKGVELYSEDEINATQMDIKQEIAEEARSFDDVDVTGYKCVSCQYKTTSSVIFMEHLKIHSKEMYFKCSNCDEEFHSHWDIQEHIMNVHYSQSLQLQGNEVCDTTASLTFYECNTCKFQSTDKTVFDSHVRKHNKVVVYKCSVCSKRFKSKNVLKRHVQSHRIFKCGLCNLTFKEKSSLLEHFVQHRIKKVLKVKEEIESKNSSEDQAEEVNESWLNQDQPEEVHTQEAVEEWFTQDKEKDVVVKEEDYDKVEQLLEQLHADNPVGEDKETDFTANENPQDVTIQEKEDADTTNEATKEDEQNGFKELPNQEDETSFLLENAVFAKDEDDHLSADIDRNEDSETNDYLNDPSQYLDEIRSGSEKQEENQATDDIKKESGSNENDEIGDDAKDVTSSPVKKRVYVCSICGLRAYTESHMKRHFKSHVALEKKMYECHICNKVLTTRSNLNRHLSNHENCPGMVTCKLCNEELTDRLHLKQHLEDQHSGPQHCSFCNMEFTNKRAFKEHELTHPERAVHQCDICHKRFLTQMRLRTHLENIHNNPQDGESEDKTYKCHICSKILTTYHNLKRHVRNHEKSSGSVKCTLCSEELTDKLHLRQHVEETHPETHQCAFCQKVFSNKKVCKAHELTHPERYVYKCDICEKMFLNETRLEKHKTLFHRDPHCSYCEKEIKDPMKLFNHERRHEMYKNKFPCQSCPKVFRTPSGLKYHMSVHTGKYAVYCEICGKGMHSEIVLEEHKATHTKEIRYTCELCGRNFSSNSTYRMHRKWHDDPLPYKCKICDRKFKHTSILAVHMRRAHTGERPYKCPHCPYSFSVSSTLHKHIILHTKKYPHNCQLCGKGFTTRTKIARHMAKVHNDFEMLNAKPTPCQYKMVLKPSELSNEQPENSSSKQDDELPETKFEDGIVEEQIVDAGQAAIFLFQ
ncbi:zinc finger protein 665-like isoform X2 [Periplaneta americana]|uniref:zinc finger protein 665-like isoform X2 n=1 Tax=Periplaneta americana TaxID=6978 RepID=UPI0037E7CB8B